jgi:hypothetical protein
MTCRFRDALGIINPVRFAEDSPLEERRFEPLVPLAVKTLLGHTFPSAMTIEIKGNTIARQRSYFAPEPDSSVGGGRDSNSRPRPTLSSVRRPTPGDKGAGAGSPVQPAFCCSASHSMEPMAHTGFTGCGLHCCSSSWARWRQYS